MTNMETKTCTVCERELPLSDFSLSRLGKRYEVCRTCCAEKQRETRAAHRIARMGGGKQPPVSDPDFDGKEPREVIDLMSRAKKWLEAMGYKITLKGTYTQIREVKF